MIWLDIVNSLYDYLKADAQWQVPIELGNEAGIPTSTQVRVIWGFGGADIEGQEPESDQQIIIEGWIHDSSQQKNERRQAYEALSDLLKQTMQRVMQWRDANERVIEVTLGKGQIQNYMDAYAPSYGFRIVVKTTAIHRGFNHLCDETGEE